MENTVKKSSQRYLKLFIWGVLLLILVGVLPTFAQADQLFWSNYNYQLLNGLQSRMEFMRYWNTLSPLEQTLYERIEQEEAGNYWKTGKGIPYVEQNFRVLMKRIAAPRSETYFVSTWMYYLSRVEPLVEFDNCLSPRKSDIDLAMLLVNYETLIIRNAEDPSQDRNVRYMMRRTNARPEEIYNVCISMRHERHNRDQFNDLGVPLN